MAHPRFEIEILEPKRLSAKNFEDAARDGIERHGAAGIVVVGIRRLAGTTNATVIGATGRFLGCARTAFETEVVALDSAVELIAQLASRSVGQALAMPARRTRFSIPRVLRFTMSALMQLVLGLRVFRTVGFVQFTESCGLYPSFSFTFLIHPLTNLKKGGMRKKKPSVEFLRWSGGT